MAAPQASSRLEMLQARFQQKQLQEKEQKLLQLYDQQQQRAYQVVQRGSAGSNSSNQGSTISHSVRTSTTSTTSTGGKVRQMFDERRQTTVKGIDRSYPLEPLENKPRKQTAGNGVAGTQKNGNLTMANRQSVTVKRVTRADVNSNVNGGKPVVSYHEEITRESYGPSAHREDDEDEFGNENHVARYNGNHSQSEDERDEVQIEEIMDQDTIQRNRMMAKIHLMEFDETMKHRVRNDLESEQFPEDLMVDVPDKLPKRGVTRKLSQAEARLERFKNVNAKRTNQIAKMTPTTKKRSEPMFPMKSTLGEKLDVPKNEARENADRTRDSPIVETTKRTTSSDGERRGESPGIFSRHFEKSSIKKTQRGTKAENASSEFIKSVSINRSKSPQYYCREIETLMEDTDNKKRGKSAANREFKTLTLKPKIGNLFETVKNTLRRNDGKKSAATVNTDSTKSRVDRNFVTKREERRFADSNGERRGRRQSSESEDRDEKRSDRPQFFCKVTDKSATTMSVDSLDKQSPRFVKSMGKGGIGKVSSRPQSRESERSAVSSVDSRILRSRSPEFMKSDGNTKNIKSGKEYDARSSGFRKTPKKERNEAPQFFCRESEKSATTYSINAKSVPEPVRDIIKEHIANPRYQPRGSVKSVRTTETGSKPVSRGSPEFEGSLQKRETGARLFSKDSSLSPQPRKKGIEKFEKPTAAIRMKSGSPSGLKIDESTEDRSDSPEFFCVESEKSATTISLKPRPRESSSVERSTGNPQDSRVKSPTYNKEKDRNKILRERGRNSPKLVKTPETRPRDSICRPRSRTESENLLRSTNLVRDIIKNQSHRDKGKEVRESRIVELPESMESSDLRTEKQVPFLLHEKDQEAVGCKIGGKFNRNEIDTSEVNRESLTSTEGDTEIQEITIALSDQQIEPYKPQNTKIETVTLKTIPGKTYTKSPVKEKSRIDSLFTYPVRKSVKVRKSVLEPDVFGSKSSPTKIEESQNHRNERIAKTAIKTSRSPSPRNKPITQTSKILTRESSSYRSVSRRDNSPEVRKERRPKEPSNKGRLLINEKMENNLNSSQEILRSTELVRRAIRQNSGLEVESLDFISVSKKTEDTGHGEGLVETTSVIRESKEKMEEPVAKHTVNSVGKITKARIEELEKKLIPKGTKVKKKTESSRKETSPIRVNVKRISPENVGDSKRSKQDKAETSKRREAKIARIEGDGKSKDFDRRDSVESALKRFDSIGADSEYQETTRLSRTDSSKRISLESILKTTTESVKDLSEVETSVSVNVSPKSPSETDRNRTDYFSQRDSGLSKSILKKSPVLCPKIHKIKITERKSFQNPVAQENRCSKKIAKARDSIEITRVKSRSPPCKRRLFEDPEKLTITSDSKLRDNENLKIESIENFTRDDTSNLSVKQLRSIEDIRREISGVTRPAIASQFSEKSVRKPLSPSLEKQSRINVTNRYVGGTRVSPGDRVVGRSVIKVETRASRVAKSPSPDPVARKAEVGTVRAATRRNVPPSPSKSPDIVQRRASTELKSQELKMSRRQPPTKPAEPIRRAIITKSTDNVDGTVLVNGQHQQDHITETKHDSTKRSDAFVIDFDEQTSKENDSVSSRKAQTKRQSVERQSSTSGGRPASVSSVSSNSSTPGQTYRGRMAMRARTPLSGVPSKVSSSKGGNTNATDNLTPCKTCGRRFAQDRVILHEQICAKTVQKKRKQFDTMMYRVKGTDLEPFVKGIKKQPELKSKKPEVKSNWRRKHEDFINAIRSAKQVQAHLAAGGKLSDLPPPPVSDTSDYIQCPHCGRKFNQAAAERHIPKCEHMLHNKPTNLRAPKPKR